MSTLSSLLESVPTTSPLGLRFWDIATGTDVSTDLSVVAYPENNPSRRVAAYRTYSGRYAFRGLPGFHAFETGAGDAAFWSFWNQSPTQQRPFIVEVRDEAGRFQPFGFEALVPGPGPSLFVWECARAGDPLSPAGTVPLYSAPARPVSGGMAVVRAEMHDVEHDTPAAWAVLEASVQGSLLARGLADDKGRVVLYFPYPRPLTPEVDSPPPGTQLPFTQQSWPLQVTARCGPTSPLLSVPAVQSANRPQIPDLCKALSQGSASLWANKGHTEHLGEIRLRYRQELVLRSHEDGSPLNTLDTLLITPAGSPP
jgi:hypothetical protein